MKLKQTPRQIKRTSMALWAASVLVVAAGVGLLGLGGESAYAADCGGATTAIISCASDENGVWAILLIAINILTAGIGIAAVGGIVYGSVLYTTAGDNESQINNAKEIIRNVVIGLIAYVGMYALLQFIIPGGVFDRQLPIPGPVASVESADESNTSSPSNETSKSGINAKIKPSEVLIVGDSITALALENRNQGNKGWWEYFLDGKEGTFKFTAQGGAGYIKPSAASGNTFTKWLSSISTIKPKAIIIAGGYNDQLRSDAASGIKAYYDTLDNILKTNNINPKNVYVFVPRIQGKAENMPPIIEANATRIGANYIDVGTYKENYDGVHPTSKSAKIIADNFAAGSNFDERLVSQNESTSSSATAYIDSLVSVNNARDASISSGGNILKKRVLYRSAQMNKLGPKDSKTVAELLDGGGVIIDLRTADDARAAPDTPISGVQNVNIPIDGIHNTTPMVTDPVRRAQLAKALKLAANTDGPVYIHCVAGKDRTGWMVAMIMHVAGANYDQILREYLKSNEDIPDGVKKEWLADGIREAKSEHDTVTGYLRSIGLSKDDLAKLKAKFGA